MREFSLGAESCNILLIVNLWILAFTSALSYFTNLSWTVPNSCAGGGLPWGSSWEAVSGESAPWPCFNEAAGERAILQQTLWCRMSAISNGDRKKQEVKWYSGTAGTLRTVETDGTIGSSTGLWKWEKESARFCSFFLFCFFCLYFGRCCLNGLPPRDVWHQRIPREILSLIAVLLPCHCKV